MPERYQQNQLASSLVGTPGIDTSAGVAEAQIAQTADAARTKENQLAIAQMANAEQSFNRAGAYFNQWANQRAYEARLKKAQEAEARRLQVQFDQLDEDDLMNGKITQLKEQFANNPQEALRAFANEVPQMREEFKATYASDPVRLRMNQGPQRARERAAYNELQSWAQQTTKANLEQRLALFPQQVSDKIAGLSGSFTEQLKGFQGLMQSTNAVYDTMRLSAVTQADHDKTFLKQLALNNEAAKQFVDHSLAQTPEGEGGIKYLESLQDVVKTARQNGFRFSPEDESAIMGKIQTQLKAHEQDLIVGIQGDNAQKVLDANRFKYQLFQAADDPVLMANLAKQVDARMAELDKQIALVSQEPDSKIKNAKLTGLKQEQAAYITETGQELKQQRQFDQLQRTLTSFAQGQIRFQQSQISFQQGQQKFAQWQADLLTKGENREVTRLHTDAVDSFNKEWAGVQNSLKAAWSQPGLKSKEAVSQIVTATVPKLQKALFDGTLSGPEYGKMLAFLDEQNTKVHSATKTVQQPWYFGGGEKQVPLKPEEAKKASLAAKQQFGDIVNRQQQNFLYMNSAIKQLDTLTTSKGERAFLHQFVSANLPTMLNTKKFQAKSPQEQDRDVAQKVREAVILFRQGKLK
ncbi:MAG: hypothetical protein K2Y32_00315 [Candidatus Obscuribacterales bacterium]|nr:hypothetical protein [Candidatus Obscuribacterales bacterium]